MGAIAEAQHTAIRVKRPKSSALPDRGRSIFTICRRFLGMRLERSEKPRPRRRAALVRPHARPDLRVQFRFVSAIGAGEIPVRDARPERVRGALVEGPAVRQRRERGHAGAWTEGGPQRCRARVVLAEGRQVE